MFNQLLGAGFKEKLAAYSADLYDAFYKTLGERLGMSADELEKRYALKVRKGTEADTSRGYTAMTPQDKLDLLKASRKFDEQLKLWEQGKDSVDFDLGKPSWVCLLYTSRCV